PEEEKIIGDILSREFGIKTAAELDGKRLNRSYGYIGQEQHLYRFPGDTLEGHMENEDDWKFSYDKGIAPGLGAYGYFAPSGGLLSEKDKMRERYYIAVQTFLAPGFQNDFKGYVDFFRFRKMLVVNPDNGKAVIADIGDAGPAEWTGKSLGGSPEVMHYLQRYDGAQKGPVLYFFIDDPEDKIPLGPINIKGV
ncbi:hypothetical protein M1349_04535, partial [Patescibacteria group bacterium]|nr:hypothetical protein [Patescibacteria group bacterium]